MKKDREFNNILDECLERLLVRGETLEQCLESYPEQASELEPLLQTAVATRKILAIKPDPEFMAKARHQLDRALRETKPERGMPFLRWQPQWAFITIIALVMLVAGGGTGALASSSMPDNLLYPVKLATEEVQLRLTGSSISKAELHAKLADRRVAEIINMADEGNAEKIEQTSRRLNEHLLMITNLASDDTGATKEENIDTSSTENERSVPMLQAPAPSPAPAALQPAEKDTRAAKAQSGTQSELKKLVERNAANNQAALRKALEKAPKSAKQALRQAINSSAASYEEALKTLE